MSVLRRAWRRSRRFRVWPGSLAGQLVLLLILALLAAQALGILVADDERRLAVRSANREQVLSRTVSTVRLLAATPPELHRRVLAATSSPLLRYRLGQRSRVDGRSASRLGRRLAQNLERLLDGNEGRPVLVEVAGEPPPPRNLVGFPARDDLTGRPHWWRERRERPALSIAVALPDGRWLNADTVLPPPPSWAASALITLAVAAGLVSLVAVLVVRQLTRPLGDLARAADALGRGVEGPPLREAGPQEIRHTIRAFNRMRQRLRRFVDDRTAMLAALGHDLRTPLTSLRLRAELVDDPETRERIQATVEEMIRMSEATLSYARDAAASEPTRTVDLAALVESVVDDLADLGADAAVEEAARLPYPCRPTALRRALRNLIENAVAYGGSARVGLRPTADAVRIEIDDSGPGIPAADVERVFEPFVRLEGSRSRETGGSGLGLPIARSIARAHGGDVTLEPRTEGGTRAVLTLPLVLQD